MKIYILCLLLFVVSSNAKNLNTCNTVQLISIPAKTKDTLSNVHYPKDCKVMQIGNSATVRCGCFNNLDGAKQRLEQLKQKYSHASLASTYSYRFSNTNKQISSPTKVNKHSSAKQIKKNRSCYSISLISVSKTQKNLDKLYKQNYPQECKVMEFQKTFGVRCGCFNTLDEAKQREEELQRSFKNTTLKETYRYRFEPDYFVPRMYRDSNEKVSDNEKELRLMLQVFLYKGDLKSAYQVATIGYNQYPNSYYWNQKMADICQWTNRSARAMKHLRKMYEIRYDPVLEDKLINYGMAYFQYEAIEPLVLNKARKYPTEKNIDNLINVYKKIGLPEEVLKVLESEYKRTSNPLLLTKALELSLEIGDLESAQKYITMILKNKPYSKIDAGLIAKYYYINRQIKQAYMVLSDAKNRDIIEDKNNSKELNYFYLTSDIAWYLQKNIAAAKASKKLMDVHKARLVDYERISLVYPNINNNVAMEAVKQGYQKYHLAYMFFSYANDAIAKRKFKDLAELLKSVDEKKSPLAKKPMYWIIKSKVYNHYKKFDKEELALKKALELAPDNTQIKISLLWHFMEINDIKNTKLILLDIEDGAPLNESLYFPLASAYFYLNNINRASYYLDEMRFNNDQEINTIPYKFLLAYVKQIQNEEASFQKLMHEITDTLNAKMKHYPALKKDDETLSNYLRAAMYVLNPDKFEKKLSKAKPYLKKKNYDEIAYSWAVYNKAYEKSHKIYNHTKHKELWILFSDAIIFQHHTNTENLLDKYLQLLSQGDAVGALLHDGQTALAQSTNFKLLNNNDANQNAYIRQIELSKTRTDMLDAKISRYLREPLQQIYLQVANRSYIGDSWYVTEAFNVYSNKSTDTNYLINPPATTYRAQLGIKKEIQRGYLSLNLAYNHSICNYFSLLMDGEYRISTDFSFGGAIGKNVQADESTQLYLGGKKDIVSPRLKYQILNSTSINIRYEKAKFYSQDDVYLGKSDYFNTNISWQVRSGYPDILLGLFYDRGLYYETSGSRGVIDRLQTQNFQVLPNKFYNIGLNISYGMVNKNIYTRVWRPYFEFAPYYNSDLDDYTYGFHAGYGGKVFHQDHMSIGVSYTDSVNGIGGKIFEFYIDYQFLYTLSKEI